MVIRLVQLPGNMLTLILSLFAVQVAVSQVSFDTSYEGKQGTDLNLLNVKATTSSGASLPVGALTSAGAGRKTGVVVIHPGTIISVTPNGGGGTRYYQFSSKPRGSRWKANSYTMWKVSSHTSAVSDPTVFGQTVPDPSRIENADLLSWINGGATVNVRKWTNLEGAEKTDTFPLAHYSGAHRAIENYYYFGTTGLSLFTT